MSTEDTKTNTEIETIAEHIDLLCCKACGNSPSMIQVFCTGMYYKCACGAPAYRYPLPQTESFARKVWNYMNAA